jgi:monovalent cation/hydrogen antiporter
VHELRGSNVIGDDAFHRMEEELDWLEMAGGSREEGDHG